MLYRRKRELFYARSCLPFFGSAGRAWDRMEGEERGKEVELVFSLFLSLSLSFTLFLSQLRFLLETLLNPSLKRQASTQEWAGVQREGLGWGRHWESSNMSSDMSSNMSSNTEVRARTPLLLAWPATHTHTTTLGETAGTGRWGK